MVKEKMHNLNFKVSILLLSLLILIIPVTILMIEPNTLTTRFVEATSDNVDEEIETNRAIEGEEKDEDQREDEQQSERQEKSIDEENSREEHKEENNEFMTCHKSPLMNSDEQQCEVSQQEELVSGEICDNLVDDNDLYGFAD